MVNIENHENRFADMESGREADVQGGRRRQDGGSPGRSAPFPRDRLLLLHQVTSLHRRNAGKAAVPVAGHWRGLAPFLRPP